MIKASEKRILILPANVTLFCIKKKTDQVLEINVTHTCQTAGFISVIMLLLMVIINVSLARGLNKNNSITFLFMLYFPTGPTRILFNAFSPLEKRQNTCPKPETNFIIFNR